MSSSASAISSTDGSASISNQSETEETEKSNGSQSQVPYQHYVARTSAEAFGDGDTYLCLNPELVSVAEIACDSSSEMHGSEGLVPNGGSLEFSPPGQSFGVQPSTRPVSLCPHYAGGEVVAGPRSVCAQPVSSSPVILIPSWIPLGKQGFTTSSLMFDLTNKFVTGRMNNHTERSQVSPPLLAVQPPLTSPTTISTSLLSSSIAPSKASPTSCLTTSTTKISTSCFIDGKSSTSVTTCIITTTAATLVTTTSTVASNLQNICSPTSQSAWYPWQPSHSFVPSSGNLVAPSLYRYTNQSVWVGIPSYPYPRTGVPCYQWPTPVPAHWPVPHPLSSYPAPSSMNFNRPSYGGTWPGHPSLTEPVNGSAGYSGVYMKDPHKSKEEAASGFDHNKQYEKRSNNTSTGEYNDIPRFPPSTSFSKAKGGAYSTQKKSRFQRTSKPCSHQNFRTPNSSMTSTSAKAFSYVSKNQGPLRASSQPTSPRSADPITKVDDPKSLRRFEDSCGLMPITPPPTPVLKSDSSATILSDNSIS